MGKKTGPDLTNVVVAWADDGALTLEDWAEVLVAAYLQKKIGQPEPPDVHPEGAPAREALALLAHEVAHEAAAVALDEFPATPTASQVAPDVDPNAGAA